MTLPQELKGKMKGVFTIVLSPFNKDYSLDKKGLKDNLDFVIENGVHGLIVGGSLGEFASMSKEERKELFKTAVEAVNGRRPVVCCTASSNVFETIELTKYCEDIGADGVMITPPYYASCPDEGIYQHFKMVSDETNIGILAYNTSRAGTDMLPELIARIADIENVVASKQGTRNLTYIEQTMALVGDKIALFSGSEVLAVPLFAIGYVGTTSCSSSFMPKIMLDMYDAAMAGDFKKASEIYFRWGAYRRFLGKVGAPSVQKAAMNLLGMAGGPVRPPMINLNAEQKKELKAILNELGVL
jgi:4-hydroxy-tetrahydrodipicolinate synthase